MVGSIHGVPAPCNPMPSRLLTLLLVPLMAVVVACGSDEELQPAGASTDASQLLRDTLANSAKLKSGVLSASVRAGDEQAEVSGPFAADGKGKLPRFAFDARADGRRVGLTWTGEKGFITLDNTPYELSDLVVRQVEAGLEQAASANKQSGPLAIDVSGWLKHPRNEGLAQVGDAQTIKLSGTADKGKVLAGLQSITRQFGAFGLPRSGAHELQEYVDAVKTIGVQVYTGASDRILRRLVVETTVRDPDTEKTGRYVLDLTFTKVNQNQTINAPADPHPFSELLAKAATGNGAGLGRLFAGP
jgi:hypothetical protein